MKSFVRSFLVKQYVWVVCLVYRLDLAYGGAQKGEEELKRFKCKVQLRFGWEKPLRKER